MHTVAGAFIQCIKHVFLCYILLFHQDAMQAVHKHF